jgi:hypothetical protein
VKGTPHCLQLPTCCSTLMLLRLTWSWAFVRALACLAGRFHPPAPVFYLFPPVQAAPGARGPATALLTGNVGVVQLWDTSAAR